MTATASTSSTGRTTPHNSLSLTGRRTRLGAMAALVAAVLSLPAIVAPGAGAALGGQLQWSILLCEFSDNPAHNGPNNELNTASGVTDFLLTRGTGGAADYWNDVSGGRINFWGSEVRGWYRMNSTLANDPNISRWRRVQDCVDAAARNGYTPPAGNRIIAFRNQCGDGGTDGAGRILLDPCSPLAFAVHEMGHSFALGHSFSDDLNYRNASWSAPGEYDDEWDVMSAMHVIGEETTRWGLRPVGLNGYHLDKLGWIPSWRVVRWGANGVYSGTFTLAPLYADSSSIAQLLRIPIGAPGSYYTVEYRVPQGSDRPIGSASVQIHEVRDGRSILLRKDNSRSPTQQLVLNGQTIVRVLSSGGPTATIEVTAPVVPDVVGMHVTEARNSLKAAGYAVAITTQVDRYCNDIDFVMSQRPTGGTILLSGSTVTITIGTLPRTPCP